MILLSVIPSVVPIVLTNSFSPKGLNMIKDVINPKKCYYLGDTKDDIKAGISANAITIGVLPPQCKSDELKNILKSEGATIVLNNVKELIKYLEK